MIVKINLFKIYIALIVLFVYLPLLIIVLFSFNKGIANYFPIKGYTLKWYIEMFSESKFLISLKNSSTIAISASLIGAAIGVPCAFGLVSLKDKFSSVLMMVFIAVIAMPGLAHATMLLVFFNEIIKLRLSIGTAILSHLTFTVPFITLIMVSRLDKFDNRVKEAARDLGANGFQTFVHVTFPMIRSAIVGAILIAFALSFDEFVITFFTIGSSSTLPILIWSSLRGSITPILNSIATVILIIVILMIVIANKVFKTSFDVTF
jgi:spermidine/putrescine transport system permease protein